MLLLGENDEGESEEGETESVETVPLSRCLRPPHCRWGSPKRDCSRQAPPVHVSHCRSRVSHCRPHWPSERMAGTLWTTDEPFDLWASEGPSERVKGSYKLLHGPLSAWREPSELPRGPLT